MSVVVCKQGTPGPRRCPLPCTSARNSSAARQSRSAGQPRSQALHTGACYHQPAFWLNFRMWGQYVVTRASTLAHVSKNAAKVPYDFNHLYLLPPAAACMSRTRAYTRDMQHECLKSTEHFQMVGAEPKPLPRTNLTTTTKPWSVVTVRRYGMRTSHATCC